MKRIFIALPISETLQKEIGEWGKNFLKSAGRSFGRQVRWLAGKNLHITVIPPWYENDIEKIKEKIKGLGNRFGRFPVEFKKVDYGPTEKHPRLIWAEGKTPGEIFGLKDELGKLFSRPPERRQLRLHLTLARFRSETFPSFPIKKLDEEIFWRDEISSFVLMESHLSPAGADYEILEKINLK